MALWSSHQPHAFHVECLAVREGLRWLQRFSSPRIVVESDVNQVVGAILSGSAIISKASINVVATKDILTKFEVW